MGKINYLTPKSDDFLINLAFYESDGSTPQDITDWDITMLLKTDKSLPDDDEDVITVDGVITGAAGGIAYVSIPKAQADTLEGTYYYKLLYVDEDGIQKVFAYGVITFTIDGSSQVASSALQVNNSLSISMGSAVPVKDTFKSDQFTAIASQTLFTLSFTLREGSCRVFLNGVLQQKGVSADYQETGSGTSITFNAGLDAGDKVEVDYVVN